jgi:hypothetical protein
MMFKGGRVVQTPGQKLPYKVVLDEEGGGISEFPVATVQEGEAMIKERSPTPVDDGKAKLDGWHV